MKISQVDGSLIIDPNEEITINGTRYAGVIFQEFGCSFPNMVGQVLLVEKKENGMITLRRIKDRLRDVEVINEVR